MSETSPGHEVTRLLDQIRAVTSNPIVAKCSDQLEVICKAYMEPDQSPLLTAPGHARLTMMEQRVFNLLQARKNKTVSRDAIMAALYSDQPEDEPNIKIVDVRLCKMRKKLEGTAFFIQTVWNVGYRLIDADPAEKAPFLLKRTGARKYWAA